MPTAVTQAQSADFVRRLWFPTEIERVFQENYYLRMVPALRASFVLLLAASLMSAFVSSRTMAGFVVTRLPVLLFLGVAALHVAFLLATFRREFMAYWQFCSVVGVLVFLGAYVRASNDALNLYTAIGHSTRAAFGPHNRRSAR